MSACSTWFVDGDDWLIAANGRLPGPYYVFFCPLFRNPKFSGKALWGNLFSLYPCKSSAEKHEAALTSTDDFDSAGEPAPVPWTAPGGLVHVRARHEFLSLSG